jgi:hypothetical protein
MATIGNWGTILLSSSRNINAASGTFSFDYIEKKRLSGFPRLQKGADRLGRVSLTLNLDDDEVVSPRDELLVFLNAAKAGRQENLVLGNLDLGLHVITAIQWRVEDIQDGVITKLLVSLDFTEYPII